MRPYLYQATYTPEAWARMAKEPQDRIEMVKPAIEKMGGKLIGGWFAFGDSDVIAIAEFPDDKAAAAMSIAFTAGGAIKTGKMTPLMDPKEAVEAMRKAASTSYKPPGT